MPNDFSFKGAHDPAFPAQSRNGHEDFNPPVWGLTKREYFAGVALQGILSNPANEHKPLDIVVGAAVDLAKGLIARLEQP